MNKNQGIHTKVQKTEENVSKIVGFNTRVTEEKRNQCAVAHLEPGEEENFKKMKTLSKGMKPTKQFLN